MRAAMMRATMVPTCSNPSMTANDGATTNDLHGQPRTQRPRRPGGYEMATKPRKPGVRDVRRTLAGIAHGDAHDGLTDQEVRDLHAGLGRSRRSWARSRHVGFPGQDHMSSYLMNCPDPLRIVAWAKGLAFDGYRRKTDAELIQSYRDLLEYEPEVEAADRITDVSRATSWLDRAAASERDASVDEQKAAHERIFAERRIPLERVFGRIEP